MSWIYNQLHWHSVRCAIIVITVFGSIIWAITAGAGV